MKIISAQVRKSVAKVPQVLSVLKQPKKKVRLWKCLTYYALLTSIQGYWQFVALLFVYTMSADKYLPNLARS